MTRVSHTPPLRPSGLTIGLGLCFGFGTLFLPVTGCSGYDCEGENCGELTPSAAPTVPPEVSVSFLADHPTSWAMVREIYQEVLIYAAPPLIPQDAWYDQIASSYFLVTWTDQGDGKLIQSEKLCFVDLTDIMVATNFGTKRQSTVVPQQLINNLPTDVWDAHLSESGTPGESDYRVDYSLDDTVFNVWGMNLADPINDVCTSDESDPREYDQDKDNQPGVTTVINQEGSEFSKIYLCQRALMDQAVGQVGGDDEAGYSIVGDLTQATIDQTMYDASNPAFPDEDPEVNWKGTASYYYMVSLPDGATCQDVSRDLFGK